MNCSDLFENLGFECKRLSTGALRILSPFTYGHDGEVIGLYVEPVRDQLLVTDHADSLFHASSVGLSLTRARLARLGGMMRGQAELSPGGAISALVADDNELPGAVKDVLDSALVVSHMETMWAPRRGEPFASRLERILAPRLGNRLHRDATVMGASGHQLKIPFLLSVDSGTKYVQPVGYDKDRLWESVYKAYGKMSDLKHAGATEGTRVVVIEDPANAEDLNNAISFLTETANVLRFSRHEHWINRLAA